MRIGLTASAATVDAAVAQVVQAEADGFASMWFASPVLGDPLAAMVVAGRATSSIELGTAVLQTFTTHPVLQANRFAAVANAIGSPGRCTLGVGPSHRPGIESLGYDYDVVVEHTDEYVQVAAALLAGDPVRFAGEQIRAFGKPPARPGDQPIPVLVGALGPRLLDVAGSRAAGTVTWLANTRAIERFVAPRVRQAAADAGRPAPRIVVGLPVGVHDDLAEARAAITQQLAFYGSMSNYQRIMRRGDAQGPEDVAILGDEASVTDQISALFAAGATDLWAAPVTIDGSPESKARAYSLLSKLARS
jgi:F420-dependent oxidoreductase-like protein